MEKGADFSGAGGKGEEGCFFSPLCSQSVLFMFTQGSQIIPKVFSNTFPQDVPNSTLVLFIPYGFAQVQLTLYKLERLKIEEHISFHFATWGSKRCFYWAMAPLKERNKVVSPTVN